MDDIFLRTFGIDKGLVFLTGAGGKTSLIKRMALDAKAQGKSVLVTASTKMYLPDYCDHTDLSGGCFADSEITGGIYVVSEGLDHNKITISDEKVFCELKERFDLVLAEADGSKKKPLKGWAHYEPVVYDCGDHTIGVVNFSVVGRRVNESLVHRFELFTRITGLKEGDIVTKEHLYRLISDENGLFKASCGEKMVYFSHCTDKTAVDRQDMRTFCGDVFSGYIAEIM